MSTCTTCGQDMPSGSRFCSSCGAAQPMGPSPQTMERKLATALFADIVGSTRLVSEHDPEVVKAMLARAFGAAADAISRHEGFLEKFVGDAVVAVFGVPTTHEDDAERAVRCALEIQASMAGLNAQFVAEGRPELLLRIGIESGEVLVDLERSGQTRDFMLTGDAVNVAARLQSIARPKTVLVGPGAYSATNAVIGYEPAGLQTLKGKEEPVHAWVATNIKARRPGERVPLRVESKLVGRDAELRLLLRALEIAEAERRPILATVLGDAGVGKSRLLWELFEQIDRFDQPRQWRAGRSRSYGDVSYSALADAVKAQCEVLEDDPHDIVVQKVQRALAELFNDTALTPEIMALVGGAQEGFSREHLFDAWRRFLEGIAARYPLILAFEDMHWADDGLLHFVDYLAGWGEGPILILALARPEISHRRPGWAADPDVVSATLHPLGAEDQETMLDNLLPYPLPPELKALVMQRSGGNPLFNEEIVRMLIDRDLLLPRDGGWTLAREVEDMDVPRSIHALVAARLDALPKEEKVVLQDAAVVGRSFWPSGVASLQEIPIDETTEIFARLRAKELVVPNRPSSFSGEPEFAFHHVLIRDVAYESLPKAARAVKHVAAARWAAERAGDRKEEFAELIATHYAAAVDYLSEISGPGSVGNDLATSAFQWSLAAGKRAEKLWQMTAAIGWYERALSLGRVLGLGIGEVAEIVEANARASFGVHSFDDLARRYENALAGYREAGRDADAGRVLTSLARVDFQLGREDLVVPRFQEALELLEPLGDSPELARALNRLGWYFWRRGRYSDAEPLLRRAVEIADRVDDLVTKADAMHTLALWLSLSGSPHGLELAEESLAIARSVDDLELRLRVTANLISLIGQLAPDPVRCKELFDEGIELARKAGNKPREAWLLGNYALIAESAGDLAGAEALYVQQTQLAREVDDRWTLQIALRDRAFLRAVQGDVEGAEELAEEAESMQEFGLEAQSRMMWAFVRSMLLEARGDEAGALRCLADATMVGEENVLDKSPPYLILALVRRLARAGDLKPARWHRDNLAKAASSSVTYQTYLTWLDGLIDPDPARAAAILQDAAERLEAFGLKVDQGKCLMDRARAVQRTGRDPAPIATRAREMLMSCGAIHFAREAAELVE